MRRNCRADRYGQYLVAREFVGSHLPGLLDGMDETCRERFIRSYAGVLRSARLPAGTCSVPSPPQRCHDVAAGTRAILQVLSQHADSSGGGVALSTLLSTAGCCIRHDAAPCPTLWALEHDVRFAQECVPIPAGGTRDISTVDVPLPLPQSYRIRRRAETDPLAPEFTVDLNLSFEPADGRLLDDRTRAAPPARTGRRVPRGSHRDDADA